MKGMKVFFKQAEKTINRYRVSENPEGIEMFSSDNKTKWLAGKRNG